MKTNIFNNPCPNCKSNISLHFFRNREEIIQCSDCKSLLQENSRSKLISGAFIFVGGFFATGSTWIGIPIWIGLLIMILAIYTALKIIGFRIVKRDLIIRNKLTNEISYVNNSDWKEILNNSADTENNFEIVENLNTWRIKNRPLIKCIFQCKVKDSIFPKWWKPFQVMSKSWGGHHSELVSESKESNWERRFLPAFSVWKSFLQKQYVVLSGLYGFMFWLFYPYFVTTWRFQ